MQNFIFFIFMFVLMVYLHMRERKFNIRLFIMPLIFLFFGIYECIKVPAMDSGAWIMLILGGILGLLVGLLQGRIVKVYEKAGQLVIAGSLISLCFWLLSIPIRFGIKYGLAEIIHTHVLFSGDTAFLPYLFSIAGITLGRVLMISLRFPSHASRIFQA